jgi:predicted tellurium resistance membrane protein TerC
MLAVAGASKGNAFLLLFGLGLSIPLVVAGSSILSTLMSKYPVIVVLGAAILGKVGGEMMVTDPWIQKTFAIPHWFVYVVEATFAIGVVVVGKLIMKRRKERKEAVGEGTLGVQMQESEPEK